MTSTSIEPNLVEMRVRTLAAVADPIRLRILDILGSQRSCVCDLRDSVGIAPNLLSYHLRVLREAGLIEGTRRGRWIDYHLTLTAAALVEAALPSGLGSVEAA
jgi:ArsR family transcriptional regulator